jgi:NADH-quinone oxidoreductase subunit F
MIIASYAIRSNRAYVYVRGEAVNAARRLRHAVKEAYEAGREAMSRERAKFEGTPE